MTASISEKFENTYTMIERHLLYRARQVSSPDHTADDLVQIAAMTIFEKAQKDPTFLDRSKTYVITFGKWAMWRAAGKAQTYSRYVAGETLWTNENGDELAILDVAPSYRSNPEDIIIEKQTIAEFEMTVDEEVSVKNKQIIGMLELDYRKSYIAKFFSVSRPAISQRFATIKANLKPHKTRYANIYDKRIITFHSVSRRKITNTL